MDKADQPDVVMTKCVSGGVADQQKPCGFAAALGRRQRVAHNSTGPTSGSIDFRIQKGSWGRPEAQIEPPGARLVRQRSTSREHSPVRQYASHSVCRAAKVFPWGICHPSMMQFYSGPLMHFLSGVDMLRKSICIAASRPDQGYQLLGSLYSSD